MVALGGRQENAFGRILDGWQTTRKVRALSLNHAISPPNSPSYHALYISHSLFLPLLAIRAPSLRHFPRSFAINLTPKLAHHCAALFGAGSRQTMSSFPSDIPLLPHLPQRHAIAKIGGCRSSKKISARRLFSKQENTFRLRTSARACNGTPQQQHPV